MSSSSSSPEQGSQPATNMNVLKSKALLNFQKIGTSNGTAPPPSPDNRAAIAHEFFVADFLASASKKRRELAIEAAIEAGVLPEKGVHKAGTTAQTYDNAYLACSVTVKQPAKTLDKVKLSSELSKLVGADQAKALLEKCEKENAPATSYVVAVK